jgi:hypothetical protein
LVKALRLREEDEGIREQELIDSKMEGYNQALDIKNERRAAARQMPLSSASAPPDTPKMMNVDEVRTRMAEIRNMTNKAKINSAMKELQPHIEALQKQTT